MRKKIHATFAIIANGSYIAGPYGSVKFARMDRQILQTSLNAQEKSLGVLSDEELQSAQDLATRSEKLLRQYHMSVNRRLHHYDDEYRRRSRTEAIEQRIIMENKKLLMQKLQSTYQNAAKRCFTVLEGATRELILPLTLNQMGRLIPYIQSHQLIEFDFSDDGELRVLRHSHTKKKTPSKTAQLK